LLFPRRLFRLAGIYGLLVMLPQYFLERRIGVDRPPPITHPEYFYGFIGVAVAWQFVFLIIAADPIRYRALMLPAILEKATFRPGRSGAVGAAAHPDPRPRFRPDRPDVGNAVRRRVSRDARRVGHGDVTRLPGTAVVSF
jgi:hypothetical protein